MSCPLTCSSLCSPSLPLSLYLQEGQDYLTAMACAANYAWVNRSSMTFLCRQAFAKMFNSTPDDLDMHVVYDVSHNIAKARSAGPLADGCGIGSVGLSRSCGGVAQHRQARSCFMGAGLAAVCWAAGTVSPHSLSRQLVAAFCHPPSPYPVPRAGGGAHG